eukprot:gnl/MRDRNA2_/MRDRNA2_71823_c0_seq1.p1 gnl/MRDRNA2_/MRDRNA2_71823_c0~~gnl/MRDRNA2_/MRDRNA2_71823_c0_seq1.p1  ORF type:complete len:374 (-),score=64.84 gnl/MRDRNA2_/MRDRNA2_71823_c0_seq1:24-1145(-)
MEHKRSSNGHCDDQAANGKRSRLNGASELLNGATKPLNGASEHSCPPAQRLSPAAKQLIELEHETRTRLAAGLRYLHKQDQSDMCAGFFAARHPVNKDWFYAHRHGLFFEEVKPTDFFLYSMKDGGKLVQGEQVVGKVPGTANNASAPIKAFYNQDPTARPNAPVIPLCLGVFGKYPGIEAMIHAHGPNSMALSSLPSPSNEVLPMSEHSFMFYERVKYVTCNFWFDPKYIEEICGKLADYPNTFALQARNHSYFMVAGPGTGRGNEIDSSQRSIHSCFLRSYMFEESCKIQLKVMGACKEGERPHVPSAEECAFHRMSYEGYCEEATGNKCPPYDGGLEFPGILRKLERESPGWTELPEDVGQSGYGQVLQD